MSKVDSNERLSVTLLYVLKRNHLHCHDVAVPRRRNDAVRNERNDNRGLRAQGIGQRRVDVQSERSSAGHSIFETENLEAIDTRWTVLKMLGAWLPKAGSHE